MLTNYYKYIVYNIEICILIAILEKQIRIPRCLSVKASEALKGFLNKVCIYVYK